MRIVGRCLATIWAAPRWLDFLRPVLQKRPVWSTHLGQPGLVEVRAFLWSEELLPQLRPVLPGLLGFEFRKRPFCIRIEPQGLGIEELQTAQSLRRAAAQSHVGLAFLAACRIQAAVGAVVECGRLAFVDGRGLREDDWELQPRSFVAIHVQVSGRSRVRRATWPPHSSQRLPISSQFPQSPRPRRPATSAIDEAVLNIDVVAKHDSDADGDSNQSLQAACPCPCPCPSCPAPCPAFLPPAQPCPAAWTYNVYLSALLEGLGFRV